MTLARRHIQRLWHPRPGEAGAIPSRAVLGVSPQAFDAAMPNEFWREVVDRCQEEAPDCLLLAEAFWMMESYFVRSLGMHRVYNSAFMHLLRDENGEEYQRILAEGLAFSPAVLERFVNFVSNPDEEPAAKQFGKSDKYFGIATLMATLPGLPMFGHGQMEGLEEKYGMEYSRSYVDEAVDEGFLQWHRERVVPLLYERRRFSGVAWFSLFAARDGYGERAHHVYAYANRTTDGELPSLVVFNNQPNGTRVHLLDTVPFNTGPSDAPVLETRTLAEALGVPRDPDVVVAMWELWGQGWRLICAEQLFDEGLWLDLRPYETQVVLDVRCIPDPTGALGQRADELAGAIVLSIDPPEQTEEPPTDAPAPEAPVDEESDEESDQRPEVPTEPEAQPSEPATDVAPV